MTKIRPWISTMAGRSWNSPLVVVCARPCYLDNSKGELRSWHLTPICETHKPNFGENGVLEEGGNSAPWGPWALQGLPVVPSLCVVWPRPVLPACSSNNICLPDCLAAAAGVVAGPGRQSGNQAIRQSGRRVVAGAGRQDRPGPDHAKAGHNRQALACSSKPWC